MRCSHRREIAPDTATPPIWRAIRPRSQRRGPVAKSAVGLSDVDGDDSFASVSRAFSTIGDSSACRSRRSAWVLMGNMGGGRRKRGRERAAAREAVIGHAEANVPPSRRRPWQRWFTRSGFPKPNPYRLAADLMAVAGSVRCRGAFRNDAFASAAAATTDAPAGIGWRGRHRTAQRRPHMIISSTSALLTAVTTEFRALVGRR